MPPIIVKNRNRQREYGTGNRQQKICHFDAVALQYRHGNRIKSSQGDITTNGSEIYPQRIERSEKEDQLLGSITRTVWNKPHE